MKKNKEKDKNKTKTKETPIKAPTLLHAVLPTLDPETRNKRQMIRSGVDPNQQRTQPVRIFSSVRNNPERWVSTFLQEVSDHGLIKRACDIAGVTQGVAYRLRKQDDDFARDWDEALQSSVEGLELIARDRATAYSDNLLMFLLKGNNPEKFADKVTLRTDQTIQRQLERMAEKMGIPTEELVETVRQLSADTIEGEYAIVEDPG